MSTTDEQHPDAAPDVAPDPMAAFMALLPPDALEDPYPFYAQLREVDPVLFVEPLNGWILTGHADVAAVFGDDRFVMGYEQAQRNRTGDIVFDQPYFEFGRMMVVSTDPPLHTRLRRVFRQPFTARRVAALGDTTFRVTHEVLEERVGDGTTAVDVIDAIARHVPMRITSSLMGVPIEDEDTIRGFVEAMYAILVVDPLSPEQLAAANATATDAFEYFTALIENRRRSPDEDFISSVLEANEADPEPLTDREIAANVCGMYFAGYDTQSLSIGLLLATLDRHPEVRRWLAEDTTRVADAIPELLRYDQPGQFMPRVATEDVIVGGKEVLAGQSLLVSMGAANHDPAVFERPGVLDLDRMAPADVRATAMTFGRGRHHCIGSHLAPNNLTCILQAVLGRFPEFVVHHELAERQPLIAARGYASLPVTFRP